jgi:hypothetical protein
MVSGIIEKAGPPRTSGAWLYCRIKATVSITIHKSFGSGAIDGIQITDGQTDQIEITLLKDVTETGQAIVGQKVIMARPVTSFLQSSKQMGNPKGIDRKRGNYPVGGNQQAIKSHQATPLSSSQFLRVEVKRSGDL